jgi:hypothetical protein
MHFHYQWVNVTLLCAFAGLAQQPTTAKDPDPGTDGPSSTITGRVYLADTKGPARKAEVYLQPAAALMEDSPPDHGVGQRNGSVTIGVQARFDGTFSFTRVPAGTYYLIASYPGYISPYAALSLAEARSEYGTWKPLGLAQQSAKELVLKSIPRITVQSGLPSSVDLTLEHGAAISGTITYDDGSPAAGLEVTALARMLREGKETWGEFKSLPGSQFAPIYTDDRGNYRISGLPRRKYLVQITLNSYATVRYSSSTGGGSSSSNNGASLPFYSGSTSSMKEAVSFSLASGEERTGEDLVLPISKLRTITGHVVSANDGHVINGAQIHLYRADDRSMVGLSNSSEDNPGFTLSFIYDGDYILSSPMSFDVDYQPLPQQPGSPSPPVYDTHPRHLYGSASQPLHVEGDMDGVIIAVPEPTDKEAQTFKGAFEQQEQQNQPPIAK